MNALDVVNEGWVRPHVDRTLPLQDAGAAHEHLEQRRNIRKGGAHPLSHPVAGGLPNGVFTPRAGEPHPFANPAEHVSQRKERPEVMPQRGR